MVGADRNREGRTSVTGIRPRKISDSWLCQNFISFLLKPSFMVPLRQVLASLCPGRVRFESWVVLGFKGIALTKVKVTP